MSSITFPYGGHVHSASSSFVAVQDSRISSYEPPNDTSSFQMNPLSSHPPRTPRTSIISNGSHVLGSDVYDSREDRDVTSQAFEVEESEDEDEMAQDTAKDRVRREDVWREMLKTAYGRDKAFVRPPLMLCSCVVLLFSLKMKCLTDERALRAIETATVLNEDVSSLPRCAHHEFCVPRTDTARMGGGTYATSHLCRSWVFVDEVSVAHVLVAFLC